LAEAAGRDPVAWRLELLAERPLHAAVLRRAAEASGWDRPAPPGRARGVALHESFGSVLALVLEASLDQRRPRVHRVVCALDCGTVVNPDIVAQQLEGGVMFGLAAALHGRIDIEAGVVQQRNFPDQPLIALRDTPAIETHVLESDRPPGGVGEVAVPPVAPALAAALYRLTGRRLRDLRFGSELSGRARATACAAGGAARSAW
jgi:isoquinoline 1-oxidoreductase beta subunit